jgi:hypothetical protein
MEGLLIPIPDMLVQPIRMQSIAFYYLLHVSFRLRIADSWQNSLQCIGVLTDLFDFFAYPLLMNFPFVFAHLSHLSPDVF